MNGNTHIEFNEKKGLVGTIRYTSTNSQLGYEQSRRDDLESIGYLMIYFAKGTLPWQDLDIEDRDEKLKKVLFLKQTTPIESLTKNLPESYKKYFEYVKNLKFSEEPDYIYLKSLFQQKDKNFLEDFEPDWIFKIAKYKRYAGGKKEKEEKELVSQKKNE